jgi:hypothetical protein
LAPGGLPTFRLAAPNFFLWVPLLPVFLASTEGLSFSLIAVEDLVVFGPIKDETRAFFLLAGRTGRVEVEDDEDAFLGWELIPADGLVDRPPPLPLDTNGVVVVVVCWGGGGGCGGGASAELALSCKYKKCKNFTYIWNVGCPNYKVILYTHRSAVIISQSFYLQQFSSPQETLKLPSRFQLHFPIVHEVNEVLQISKLDIVDDDDDRIVGSPIVLSLQLKYIAMYKIN